MSAILNRKPEQEWHREKKESDVTKDETKLVHVTYTISIAPSTHPGKVTATSSDGHVFTASEPLFTGARYWQAHGAPSSASILTIWSSGPGHRALRSTIGYAAKLAVGQNRFGTPVFV